MEEESGEAVEAGRRAERSRGPYLQEQVAMRYAKFSKLQISLIHAQNSYKLSFKFKFLL